MINGMKDENTNYWIILHFWALNKWNNLRPLEKMSFVELTTSGNQKHDSEPQLDTGTTQTGLVFLGAVIYKNVIFVNLHLPGYDITYYKHNKTRHSFIVKLRLRLLVKVRLREADCYVFNLLIYLLLLLQHHKLLYVDAETHRLLYPNPNKHILMFQWWFQLEILTCSCVAGYQV